MELRKFTDRLPLARLAAEYLAQEVHGVQSDNTLEAKTRDLTGFVRWFAEYNGHGDPGLWLPRDTQSYLRVLEGRGRAPTTINRVLATLGHFARWCHELPGQIFASSGLPTRGIKALMVSEPDCKKLSPRDCHALFKAADLLVANATHARAAAAHTRDVCPPLLYRAAGQRDDGPTPRPIPGWLLGECGAQRQNAQLWGLCAGSVPAVAYGLS